MLYNQARVQYGPGAKLDAAEPYSIVVMSFGSTARERSHRFFVRRVQVTPLRRHDTPTGYTWCLFPDDRVMLVHDDKIHAQKIVQQAGPEREAA